MRRCALVCLVVLVAASALAQTELVVNGVVVPGVRNDLVAGTAYAPAAALAEALGARLDVDLATRRLTLTLGGRVVQVRAVDDPGAAASLPEAIRRDGVGVAGGAGVLVGFEAFVPVKATAEALGARVTFLAATNQVLVVLPRPSLAATVEGSGSAERLVLRLNGPTRVTSFVNQAVQTLHLRFERSDLASPMSFVGDAFVRADVAANRGDVDVRIQLAPDVHATWTELPDGAGFAVVVAFARSVGGAPVPVDASAPTRIVIDPAGGTGPAARDAAADTLEVARIVAQRLERAGYDVALTRVGPTVPAASDRAAQGTGARLFLTLQVADVPRGSLRVFHLGDAAELSALEDAVRINAEAVLQRPETDGVRRHILLDLVVDLERGARYAEALGAALRDAGGFVVVGPRAVPVAVLTGAAGRGVLLEVAAADLRDPAFAPLLAAALASVVASGGALR